MTQSYDTIPVFSGQAVPSTEGFYQPEPVQTATDGLLGTDQARAVAEVQAALIIAARRPRNEFTARDRLIKSCQRKGLAETAIYQYSRGGSRVQGPSIRLAEAAARAWGNINYGFRELSRTNGVSECEAYAWDLETNTKAVRQFSVRHIRNTKRGDKGLTDERDIYEFLASQAQRRVRACLLEIIPGDIIEDAIEQCDTTMRTSIGDVVTAIKGLVATFNALGVSKEAIEKRLGHRVESMEAAQVASFRKIYTSIKDGMSTAADWFDLGAEQKTESVEKQPTAPAVESTAPTSPVTSRGRKKTDIPPVLITAIEQPQKASGPASEDRHATPSAVPYDTFSRTPEQEAAFRQAEAEFYGESTPQA